MASDLTLRIEHASGETSTLTVPDPVAIDSDSVTLATISITRDLERVARCEARVFRSEWSDVLSLVDRRDDKVFVDDDAGNTIFGGRLDDWEFSGTQVSVFVNSFEIDAGDADPPASFSRSVVSDQSVASDLIGLMDAPNTAGTVEETTASLDFAATHTSPGTMLRDLAATTGADVRYRPDGTVDYLAARGATISETLSPADGDIVGDPTVRETARRDRQATKIRVVSASDPTIYEEATVVSNPARDVVYTEELDSTSSSRLQTRADALADEISAAPEYLEIRATVDPDVIAADLAVGDTVPIALPADDVDADLRLIQTTRRIDEGGETLDVLAANRRLTLADRSLSIS